VKILNLKLNHFELGYLYTSIKQEAWDKMPRKLWLRLHILSTGAYLEHEVFGKQAEKDIKQWSKELSELEKNEN
jgi:hypothetical protein